MFTSWSEVETPAELSMASVLISTLQRILHAPELREAEVAALGDHPAAQVRAVHADRVVRAVTTSACVWRLDLT